MQSCVQYSGAAITTSTSALEGDPIVSTGTLVRSDWRGRVFLSALTIVHCAFPTLFFRGVLFLTRLDGARDGERTAVCDGRGCAEFGSSRVAETRSRDLSFWRVTVDAFQPGDEPEIRQTPPCWRSRRARPAWLLPGNAVHPSDAAVGVGGDDPKRPAGNRTARGEEVARDAPSQRLCLWLPRTKRLGTSGWNWRQ